MSDYQNRIEAKRERLLQRAAKADQKASQAEGVIDGIRDAIPMGQPILVGHHSERRHRRDLARWDRKMQAAQEERQKAARLRQRAEAVGTGGISADDPDAVAKLQGELSVAEAKQALWKNINATIRKNAKAGLDAQVQALTLLDIPEPLALKLATPTMGEVGIPRFKLTNNGANIRRLRQRIEQLEAAAAARATEIQGEGWTYFEDPDDNRLGFIFEVKPSEEVRATLRVHGFRWSPTRGAWIRHLHTSRGVAAYVRKLLAERI